MRRLEMLFQVLRNMGIRYVLFRAKYEFLRRSGWLKHFYPVSVGKVPLPSLEEWRGGKTAFFFSGREAFSPIPLTEKLKEDAQKILAGYVPFFSSGWMAPEQVANWHIHPETGHDFGAQKHWTQIESLDPASGDIKYVWERARFSHLLTVMRYDRASGEDHSAFVIGEILDFIRKNPLNTGPDYVCSQEISIRLMNWLFLLRFYKDSAELTPERFAEIMKSIYGQLCHVYSNIDFSCIAVRNNHAITECSMLYIGGLLFPGLRGAAKWKRLGLKRLIGEVAYQIYLDGTHLQFSTNYHRVVLQTLTYVIALMRHNDQTVPEVIQERFKRSIEFLYRCQDSVTGQLPNYGANDGALFFPLSDCDYRDYRPQLDAAYRLISGKDLYDRSFEDRSWFGLEKLQSGDGFELSPADGVFEFPYGGLYIIRDSGTLTLFKCGAYRKDRPSHADGLHLDIWVDGENILPDGGSYKYNTDPETLRYFCGTESHNTVMLGDFDQMKKGFRFIWYNWIDFADFRLEESSDSWCFTGKIRAFRHLREGIIVTRQVRKFKGVPHWHVSDTVSCDNSVAPLPELRQIWHTGHADVSLLETNGKRTEKERSVSGYYGIQTPIRQIEISTEKTTVDTTIKVKKQ